MSMGTTMNTSPNESVNYSILIDCVSSICKKTITVRTSKTMITVSIMTLKDFL